MTIRESLEISIRDCLRLHKGKRDLAKRIAEDVLICLGANRSDASKRELTEEACPICGGFD
jgi:hypothetical protein